MPRQGLTALPFPTRREPQTSPARGGTGPARPRLPKGAGSPPRSMTPGLCGDKIDVLRWGLASGRNTHGAL
jgi:hypothetical protein